MVAHLSGVKLSQNGAKTFVTCDSRVVPHRSTEQAQGCLTSEFGWDPVLSPWYERMMRIDPDCGTRDVAALRPL
jgi:hypothetical protein